PRSFRTRTRKDMNLDTIKEKIACDCYTILGVGSFETPRTCLSRQPIIDAFTRHNLLAQSYAPVQNSLRIMSRLVESYEDFGHAFAFSQGERLPFIEYIRREKCPPEEIATLEGIRDPLTGLIELLAIGRTIEATDV